MKIAITATGPSSDCDVDPRFGRAAYFLIGDTETMAFSAIANDNTGAGGAGIGAAKLVADQAVQAVLTGHCGPNAERTLRAAGITLYTGVSGSAIQAAEAFKTGTLTPAAGPNVNSHFGMGD